MALVLDLGRDSLRKWSQYKIFHILTHLGLAPMCPPCFNVFIPDMHKHGQMCFKQKVTESHILIVIWTHLTPVIVNLAPNVFCVVLYCRST